jgi:hypothetical protein
MNTLKLQIWLLVVVAMLAGSAFPKMAKHDQGGLSVGRAQFVRPGAMCFIARLPIRS